MPPKKDVSAEVHIYEDVYIRAKKFFENKPAPVKPKGDLTLEDLSLPLAFQQIPEIKHAVQYWHNGGTVKYVERGVCKWATNAKDEKQSEHEEIKRPRKEVMDFAKVLKAAVKTAEKVKNQCFKQFEKCEAKSEKRKGILEKMKETEGEINDALRDANAYATKRKLFATKFMYGSKLGMNAPLTNVAVVVEVSDRMAEWMDEAREDVLKFFGVLEKMTDSFNLYLAGPSVTAYKPQYQLTHSKTGSADCQKWFQKSCSAKAAQQSPWPPDWNGLFHTLVGEDTLPSSIHIVCSKAPSSMQRVAEYIQEVRKTSNVPIPVTIVCFDPEVDKDPEQRVIFENLAGEGDFMVDSTKIDMDYVDKILVAVKAKKKALDKLQKQLDKVEDVSALVETNRKLLQVQISLENFVRNDLDLLDVALKRPVAVEAAEPKK